MLMHCVCVCKTGPNIANNKYIYTSGVVSDFWSVGCELASEVSRKFLAPPVNF